MRKPEIPFYMTCVWCVYTYMCAVWSQSGLSRVSDPRQGLGLACHNHMHLQAHLHRPKSKLDRPYSHFKVIDSLKACLLAGIPRILIHFMKFDCTSKSHQIPCESEPFKWCVCSCLICMGLSFNSSLNPLRLWLKKAWVLRVELGSWALLLKIQASQDELSSAAWDIPNLLHNSGVHTSDRDTIFFQWRQAIII